MGISVIYKISLKLLFKCFKLAIEDIIDNQHYCTIFI